MCQDGTLPFGDSFYKESQNVRALSFVALTFIGRVGITVSLWLDRFGIGVNFPHVLSQGSLCLLPVDMVCMLYVLIRM